MGRFEEIQIALSPLVCQKFSFHVPSGTIEVFARLHEDGVGPTILFHEEADGTAGLWFPISPLYHNYTFIDCQEELVREENMIVIPGRNVFAMMGKEYPKLPEGYLPSLAVLSRLVAAHASRLTEAFREQNIKKTYRSLILMEGNNDRKIQDALRPIYAPSFIDEKRRERDGLKIYKSLRAGFAQGERPGLLEQVQTAVRPLTDEGKIALKSVRFNSPAGKITVRLASPEIGIRFVSTLTGKKEVRRYFCRTGDTQFFDDEFLFPALDIRIPIAKGDPVRGIDELIRNDPVSRAQDEIEDLLAKSGFIAGLGAACAGIAKKIPVIVTALDAGHRDETMRLYNQYRDMHGPAGVQEERPDKKRNS